jgi:hypothetical protein
VLSLPAPLHGLPVEIANQTQWWVQWLTVLGSVIVATAAFYVVIGTNRTSRERDFLVWRRDNLLRLAAEIAEWGSRAMNELNLVAHHHRYANQVDPSIKRVDEWALKYGPTRFLSNSSEQVRRQRWLKSCSMKSIARNWPQPHGNWRPFAIRKHPHNQRPRLGSMPCGSASTSGAYEPEKIREHALQWDSRRFRERLVDRVAAAVAA